MSFPRGRFGSIHAVLSGHHGLEIGEATLGVHFQQFMESGENSLHVPGVVLSFDGAIAFQRHHLVRHSVLLDARGAVHTPGVTRNPAYQSLLKGVGRLPLLEQRLLVAVELIGILAQEIQNIARIRPAPSMPQLAKPDSLHSGRREGTRGLEGISLIGRDFGRAHIRGLNQRRHKLFAGRPGPTARAWPSLPNSLRGNDIASAARARGAVAKRTRIL
jgi:hypothetical protein